MVNNISMENDRKVLGHFKTVCDCHTKPEKAQLYFSDLVAIGIPICGHCGVDMELVGVEINN